MESSDEKYLCCIWIIGTTFDASANVSVIFHRIYPFEYVNTDIVPSSIFFFFWLLCSLLKWSFVCNLNQHSFSTLKIENVKMPHRDIIVQSKNSLAETENEWNQFNPNETRKWHDIPRKINLAWCVTVNLQLYDKWLCSCVCFSAKRHSNSIQFNKEKKMHDLWPMINTPKCLNMCSIKTHLVVYNQTIKILVFCVTHYWLKLYVQTWQIGHHLLLNLA